MRVLRAVMVALSGLLLAAHFFRARDITLLLVALAVPLLLAVSARWAPIAIRVLLLAGAFEWVRTLAILALARQAAGEPYVRLAIILGAVAAFTAAAALLPARRTPPAGWKAGYAAQ